MAGSQSGGYRRRYGESRTRPVGDGRIAQGDSRSWHWEVSYELSVFREPFRCSNGTRWVPHLAKTCSENGLLDAQTSRYRVPPEISMAFCQTDFGAYEEISMVSMDNSSPDAQGPRLRALIEKAQVELRSGVWLDNQLEVTVARKVV